MEMRAMVLEEFGGKLKLETRPVPEPGAGEVLVQVLACGAGLTLENVRSGTLGGSTPRIMGHEFSGTIVSVGAGVDGWHEGDLVTASFYLFCGYCQMCASGRETLCLNSKGYIGSQIDGAFAQYAIVPARNLVHIPDGIVLREAGVIADAVATPYHVARTRAHIVPGQNVAVIGAGGGVGVHMLQVARAFGAFVIAVERDPAKLVHLRGLEIDAIVDSRAESWQNDLVEAAHGQLDVCIDFVGTPTTLDAGVAALGRGGTFVAVGVPPNTRSIFNSAGVVPESPTGAVFFDLKRKAAEVISESGIPCTILQPTTYMENLTAPWSVPAILEQGVIAYPLRSDLPAAWLSMSDEAVAKAENGTMEITANPFRLKHNEIHMFDDPKHLLVTTKTLEVAENGITRIVCEMACESHNGNSDDLLDGMIGLVVGDFSTGMIFDWVLSATGVGVIYERLPIPGVTPENANFTYVIQSPFVALNRPGEFHHYEIALNRSQRTCEWSIDGQRFYAASDIPVDVKSITPGLLVCTLKPPEKGVGSISIHGQGATGYWRELTISIVPSKSV